MIITDYDKLDNIARRITFYHRVNKKDFLQPSKMKKVSQARWHFYYIAFCEGFKVWEIVRFCERHGFDVEYPNVYYGIRKMMKYEKELIASGRFNIVRNISIKDRVARNRILKIQKSNGIDPFKKPVPRLGK